MLKIHKESHLDIYSGWVGGVGTHSYQCAFAGQSTASLESALSYLIFEVGVALVMSATVVHT